MTVLRNGADVPDPVIWTTAIALERLLWRLPVAVADAAAMARDESHVPFGPSAKALRDEGLTEPDGSLHPAVRDVILCAEITGTRVRVATLADAEGAA